MDLRSTRVKRIRIRATRILRVLCLLAFGGGLATSYLEWAGARSPQVSALDDALWPAVFILFWLWAILRPEVKSPPEGPRAGYQPSSAISGVTVTFLTGAAVSLVILWWVPGIAGGAAAAAAMGLTLGIAWLTYRFASTNADMIGEARFRSQR